MAQTAMARGVSTRVLLIDGSGDHARRLGDELLSRGLEVITARSAFEGVSATRERGADVVVLCIPTANVDVVAMIAALKTGPYPPVLILLDSTDEAAALSDALPKDQRPDAVLPLPCEPSKLLTEMQCLLGEDDADWVDVPSLPSLAEILISLHECRESGVLEIRSEGVCTAFHLRDGQPVFVEGGSLRETLGRMLLRRGEIREEDFMRVVERMTEGLIENETLRMGEVLIELDILTPSEVFEALSVQMREKIVNCFRYERFEYAFRQPVEETEGRQDFECPPLQSLVLAGVRTHYGPDRLADLLSPFYERFPALRASPAVITERFQMTTPEQKLLWSISGDRTLATVQSGSDLDPVHASQVVAALFLGRALVFTEEPPEEGVAATRQVAHGDPKPAPEAGEGAGAPGIPPEPRRPAVKVPPTARLVKTDALAQLRRALGKTQPKPGQPSMRDAKTARLQAERSFRQGLRLLEQNLIPGALKEFTRAADLDADEPEYLMVRAWTEYLLAKDEEARTLARAKAQAGALRLLEHDGQSARAHAILGQLGLAEGDAKTARRHFKLALEIDPNHPEAARGMRTLARQTDKS